MSDSYIGFSNKPRAVFWTTYQIIGNVQRSCPLSGYLKFPNSVLQGSVLEPTLFTIYINNVGQNITDASLHLYADDTIVYFYVNTIAQVHLQNVFDTIQSDLSRLKPVLNVDKTKTILFQQFYYRLLRPQKVSPSSFWALISTKES